MGNLGASSCQGRRISTCSAALTLDLVGSMTVLQKSNVKIQLNKDKTKVIVCSTQNSWKYSVYVCLGSLFLEPWIQARHVGVILDSDIHFSNQLTLVTAPVFHQLRNWLRRIMSRHQKADPFFLYSGLYMEGLSYSSSKMHLCQK